MDTYMIRLEVPASIPQAAPRSVFPRKAAVKVSRKAQTQFVPISPNLGFDRRQ